MSRHAKAPGKGHIRRYHRLEKPLSERPEADLQYLVAKTREIIKTVECRVLGIASTGSTTTFLLKSRRGTLCAQRENIFALDDDESEMRILSDHEAIALWNICREKLSADSLFA